MTNAIHNLPPSNSPSLALLHPTSGEKTATWSLNGQIWRGAMDLPTYLRRETHLENQAFTRDGGITFWILVDTTLPPNARPILASCESLRKRAVIARGDGQVSDIISHGIGSVFCNLEHRGRGYAQRMITELGKKLDNWQQKDEERASFTVLYSDIGKGFYSRLGWHAFPSSHIALPPIDLKETAPRAKMLYAKDLAELCDLDEKWLRKDIAGAQNFDSKIRVALIPDVKTMQWHHAREEFAGKEMLGRSPNIKGALAETESGARVWCIWTRTFGGEKAGNTLNILRFVIEGDQVCRHDRDEPVTLNDSNQARIEAGAEVLRLAQIEAAKWDMKDIQIWNPTPMTVSAARNIEPSSLVIHRDEESIASLRWHGLDPEDRWKVDWVGNEKYGWC